MSNNKQKKVIGIVSLVVFYLLLSTRCLLAQSSQSVDLVIDSVPSDPSPGQSVVLEVKSFSIDLNLATINWSYGGKAIASGIGRTRVTVVAPSSGISATVTAIVNASGFDQISASIILHPGSIDMLWESPQSITPPFYKGRALLAQGGFLRVVAVPAPSAPRGISYEWSRNDSAVQPASGYGKSSYTLQNTAFNGQERIGVIASGGVFSGNGKVTVNPVTPDAIMYKKNEGFINFAEGHRATFSLSGPSTLRFEPYFFTVPRLVSDTLTFDMKLGDTPLYGDSSQNEVRLSSPAEPGTYDLSLDITTQDYSLQRVKKVFSILFQ